MVFVVMLAFPAHAGDPKLARLPFETFTLANGLRIILHEDHRTPQVAVNVWYRVGFSDDPPGKRGLAHLFEHLMLRGSKHVGRDRFLGTLERAGASERNATTSLDRTNYFETLPSHQLALALWLESDRMGFFLDILDERMLETEKEVVRNEYRTGMSDAPYSFVQRFGRNAVFPAGHPYHWVIEGEIEETASITLDDIRAFFRKYYVPNNATLSIAGDIDPAKAKALVTKYFGSFSRAGDPRSEPKPLPRIASEVRLDVETAAATPRLMIGWAGPPMFSEGDVQIALVADILARPKAGRLYTALVREMKLADVVEMFPDEMGERVDRIAWLKVELKKGIEPQKALEAVDRVLDEMRTQGPTTSEVAQSRARHADRLLWGLEQVTRRADLLNELAWYAGDPSAFTRVQASATAATPSSLRDAAARWFAPDRRAVMFVRHVPAAPVGGRLVRTVKP